MISAGDVTEMLEYTKTVKPGTPEFDSILNNVVLASLITFAKSPLNVIDDASKIRRKYHVGSNLWWGLENVDDNYLIEDRPSVGIVDVIGAVLIRYKRQTPKAPYTEKHVLRKIQEFSKKYNPLRKYSTLQIERLLCIIDKLADVKIKFQKFKVKKCAKCKTGKYVNKIVYGLLAPDYLLLTYNTTGRGCVHGNERWYCNNCKRSFL